MMNCLHIWVILVWACMYFPMVTYAQCDFNNSTTSQNPCKCGNTLVVITVNDSLSIGDTIAVFNSTTDLTYIGNCDHSAIENNQVKLKLKLRDPCYSGQPGPCTIDCSSQKGVEVFISNDDLFPPQFPQAIYNVTIPEDLGLDQPVFGFDIEDHKPTDDDCTKDSLQYSFYESQDGDGHFDLPNTGPLKLKKVVDYEDTKEYSITIQAKSASGQNTGTTIINVLIGDVDDNDPAFDQPLGYVLKFKEETKSFSLSSSPSILCRDQDTGINQTVLYSFKDYENTTDFLIVHSHDGTFDVDPPLDREQNSTFIFELWCYQSDKPYKRAVTTLHVDVLDINDNLAEFDPVMYDVTLVENAIGYVTTVVATDADIGDNAEILFEIVDGEQSDILSVDERTGVVTVVSPVDLDREATSNITVQIRAKDLDGNYSTNIATVVVTLQDINDNSPVFDNPFYLFNLNDSYNKGVIGQVRASDKDEPMTPNSNVTYSLYQGTSIVPFNLDPISGDIETTDQFNSSAEYDFIIQACDNPEYENDRRCSVVDIKVVYGRNFTFTSTDVFIEVREDIPIATRIGNMLPVTGDLYQTSSPEFEVDTVSSLVVTKGLLDRETNDTYYFNINVWEYNTLKGNISVTINVTDINDNSPLFSQKEYYFTIPQGALQNAPLGTLNASDEDTGQNAFLAFQFKNIISDKFKVNSQSGEVSTSSEWKEKAGYDHLLYHIIAEVSDQGVPRLYDVAPVYISAMVNKDNIMVGIPTSLSNSWMSINSNRTSVENKLADILGFDNVQITDMEEAGSLIYVNATMNGTVVPSISIQRSVVENWSPIQDMFRGFMEARNLYESDHTSLSAPEIALIAVSLAIMFGTTLSIIIVCRQWKQHVKNHKLYDSLRRPSNLYDSQELRMNFGDEIPSRLNTFAGRMRRTAPEDPLEGSFGLGVINAGFTDTVYENGPKTPTWSTGDTPRIPRWSTSDSIKDAIESLDELTTRLNSEDNISRVSNLSRSRRSVKSNVSEPRSDKIPNGLHQSTPRNHEYENLKLTTNQSDNTANLNKNTGIDKNEDYDIDNDDDRDIIMAEIDDQYVVSDTVPVISGDDTVQEEATAF